jgi:DNA-binding MarR family transcriptional regulator
MKANAVPKIEKMEDHFAYLIASLSRQLDEEVRERIRPEGIPVEQFRVLGLLSERDGASMRGLASQALVDPTTLTKMIDKMVTEALVYRAPDPEDRRKVLIYLAPKGKALYRRLSGILDDQQRVLVRKLNGPKAGELKRLLRELMQ